MLIYICLNEMNFFFLINGLNKFLNLNVDRGKLPLLNFLSTNLNVSNIFIDVLFSNLENKVFGFNEILK